MSGPEVIGGISAVIGIIDASIKIYNSARKDSKLSETFTTVCRQLPILLDTLWMCKDLLEPIIDSLPADVCTALEQILDACDDKAGKLQHIFKKDLPGEEDAWEKRYVMNRSARARSKGFMLGGDSRQGWLGWDEGGEYRANRYTSCIHKLTTRFSCRDGVNLDLYTLSVPSGLSWSMICPTDHPGSQISHVTDYVPLSPSASPS